VNVETRAVSTTAQLADLHALYSSQLLECPYEYEVAEDSFRDAICQPVDGLSDQLLLVAMESTQAVAFVHIGKGAADDGADVVGLIRSLILPRGNRGHDAGQALLDAAHEHFIGAGLRSCHIAGRYMYPCTRTGQVRSTWEHICSLLEENDYRRVPGAGWWDVMAWSDMDLSEPTLGIPEMQVKIGGAPLFPDEPSHGSAPRVTVRVLCSSEEVGGTEADIWHVPYWHTNAQDACATMGLGVSENERRRGIGRYLMERSLFEMRKAGCKHALLGVLESNEPAKALYQSMGYKTIYSGGDMYRDLSGHVSA
jgi:GNAT superfamily N-acetyltransferase